MIRSPRAAAVVAAVVALVAGVPAGRWNSGAAGASTLGVTAPVLVAGGGSAQFSGPSLAVDADDPLAVYAAAVDRRTRRCAFFRSGDGGRRWKRPTGSPSLTSFPFCAHARQFTPMTLLATGRGNAIYFAHQGWSHQDEGRRPTSSVFVSRSTDGGDSWSVSTVHDARRAEPGEAGMNYPSDLVVGSTSSGRDIVYVSWTRTLPGSAPARPPQPLLSVSVDAGGSFSSPIDVSASFLANPANISGNIPTAFKLKEHFGGEAPDLALDEQGHLFVAWVRASAALSPTPPHPRYLSRSSDHGSTFEVNELAPASHFAGPGPVLQWSAEGGPDGSLNVLLEDKVAPDQGDRDVLHRRSTDRGETWSEARVLNDDDPAELFIQVMPALRVAGDGRLDAAWWDQRDAGGSYAVDLYSASSTDGGATWSANRRVTPRSIDRRAGSWVENHGDTRQAPGIASATELIHFAWDRSPAPDSEAAAELIEAASMQFSPVTRSGDGVPGLVLAGLAGLLAGASGALTKRRWWRSPSRGGVTRHSEARDSRCLS